MLPIPGPDRTATERSIRDDLKNFNFIISGPKESEPALDLVSQSGIRVK